MLANSPPNDLFTYVNYDRQPLALHAANHPSVVSNLTNIERSPIELVFQSPPCVHFSGTTSASSNKKGARDVR